MTEKAIQGLSVLVSLFVAAAIGIAVIGGNPLPLADLFVPLFVAGVFIVLLLGFASAIQG